MEKEEQFQDSFRYKAWRRKLDDNGIKVNSVHDIYTSHGKEGKVLRTMVGLDADTPEGNKLSSSCYVKGHAVSMLVVFIDDQTGEKYVLLVRQRRVCDGSETYEHPAGMIDEGEEPLEVAARELKEEAELDVKPEDLVSLSLKPWYSATSTSDEALYFYYLERRMSRAAIQAMNGEETGEAADNEHTRLQVVPFVEAHRLISNLHGVLGHLLYLQAVGDYDTMKSL